MAGYSRRMKLRLLGGLCAIVVLLVVTAAPAAADYHSHTEIAWSNGVRCVKAQAEATASDAQGPYYDFKATAQAGNSASGGCDVGPANEVPDQTLAVRIEVWRWDGANWSLCAQPDWSYNDVPAEGWSEEFSGGNAPCGPGWYGDYSFAALNDQGAWYGYDHPVWSDIVWADGGAIQSATVRLPTTRPPLHLREAPFIR